MNDGGAVDGTRSVVRVAVRLFGNRIFARGAESSALDRALEQAHIPILGVAYSALAKLATFGAFFAASTLAILVVYVFGTTLGILLSAMLVVLLPTLTAAITYATFIAYPHERAASRRRDIDLNLPYGVNYMAATATADVLVQDILRDLAREPAYGELAAEVAWIDRDIELFGHDLPSALAAGEARTPCPRMQDFLSGMRNAIVSGGDLKTYFAAKAEQYMNENRAAQKDFLENLAILAESYVTVVVAGPLFLLVMLSVMLMVGGSGQSTRGFVFALVFMALPLAHGTFAAVIGTSTPGD